MTHSTRRASSPAASRQRGKSSGEQNLTTPRWTEGAESGEASMHLYETHLPVASTEGSRKFYVEIVGLEFAYRDPGRDAVFLFIGTGKASMLGLWGPTTTRGSDPHPCHFAIAIPLPDLLAVGKRLNDLGVSTQNFVGEETTEPSVIGWIPSAHLY